jgi:hypothetical protein
MSFKDSRCCWPGIHVLRAWSGRRAEFRFRGLKTWIFAGLIELVAGSLLPVCIGLENFVDQPYPRLAKAVAVSQNRGRANGNKGLRNKQPRSTNPVAGETDVGKTKPGRHTVHGHTSRPTCCIFFS